MVELLPGSLGNGGLTPETRTPHCAETQGATNRFCVVCGVLANSPIYIPSLSPQSTASTRHLQGFQPPAAESSPTFESSQLIPQRLWSRDELPHRTLSKYVTHKILRPNERSFCAIKLGTLCYITTVTGTDEDGNACG